MEIDYANGLQNCFLLIIYIETVTILLLNERNCDSRCDFTSYMKNMNYNVTI